MGHLVDHPEGQREDRRAGEAAHLVGDDGPAAPDVDAHAQQGVDQGDAVRAGVLAGPGDGHDVRDVGAEFEEDGLAGDGLDGFRHRGGRGRVGAEGHAAVVHVGAGHVDFQDIDVGAGVRPLAVVGVFFDGEAADVGDDGAAVDLAEGGGLVFDKGLDARVLQAYGVDHPGVALGDARGGVAEAGLAGGALQGDAAEDVEVKAVGQFEAEAEGPAGGDDRVLQAQPAEIDGKVFVYHNTSSLSNTGPSAQTRRGPFAVWTVQP